MAPPPAADRRLAVVPAPLFGSAGPFAAPFAFPRPKALSAPAGLVSSGASASLCVDRREPPVDRSAVEADLGAPVSPDVYALPAPADPG